MAENRIGSERVRLRRSQESLASQLDVSTRTIQLWEQEPSKCPSRKLCQLADIFDTTVDYLLGLSADRK